MPPNQGIDTVVSESQWRQNVAASLFQVLDSPTFVPACFVLFLALRALLVFFVPLEMSSDASWYLSRAAGIASGEGYSEGGYPTAYWPVGYPGFLAVLFYLFGQDQFVAQMANLVMAGGSFFLQLELTRRIFNSEATARLGVLLLAIYPNHIAYTSFVLTEIYCTFLLLLGAYLYIARRGWVWIIISGVVFGLAALTKPQVVFLPGLLILFGLFEQRDNLREQIVKGIALYVVMAALLVPWAVRNTQVFGEVVLISTNGGATLLTGNNPSADGGYVENDLLVTQRDFSAREQVESDRRAKELAIEWIRQNPGRFAELIPLKIWHLWAKNGEAEWAYQAGYQHYEHYWHIFRSLRWVNQIFYSLLLVGSSVAVALLVTNGSRSKVAWPWVLTGYCLVIYLTMISIVFSGQPRFHFPAMPWIIMYSAWAAVVVAEGQLGKRYDQC